MSDPRLTYDAFAKAAPAAHAALLAMGKAVDESGLDKSIVELAKLRVSQINKCAALAWAEALARLPGGTVSDEVHTRARAHFSESELMWLSVAVANINAWNRLGAAYRFTPPVPKKM